MSESMLAECISAFLLMSVFAKLFCNSHAMSLLVVFVELWIHDKHDPNADAHGRQELGIKKGELQ